MPEYSSLFVCLMGMGTVFFGLICLIALTMGMGAIVSRNAPVAPVIPAPAAAAPAVNRASAAPEANRQEIAAAVSAAIAEELGTEITGIRILSMKKL